MLVLTRKIGQALLIGPDVAVRVLDVRGDRVKLGIEAPALTEILRQELATEVREANLAAARGPRQARLPGLLPALTASLHAARGGEPRDRSSVHTPAAAATDGRAGDPSRGGL